MPIITHQEPLPSLSDLLSGNSVKSYLSDNPPVIPTEIVKWLSKLKLLYGVPFNYLVPDIRMLPPESLKFFYLDTQWIDCLIDGAYSIGRSTEGEKMSDHFFYPKLLSDVKNEVKNICHRGPNEMDEHGYSSEGPVVVGNLSTLLSKIICKMKGVSRRVLRKSDAGSDSEIVTGFLLNSAVVAGWPGLEVNGYPGSPADPGKELKLIRFDRLSDTVMLGLFAGTSPLATLAIHEPSESLHFGLEKNDGVLSVTLRYLNGSTPGAQILNESSDPVYQPVATRQDSLPAKTNRVIKITETATAILTALQSEQYGKYTGQMTSAEFGLEMIKGVEEVDFTNT